MERASTKTFQCEYRKYAKLVKQPFHFVSIHDNEDKEDPFNLILISLETFSSIYKSYNQNSSSPYFIERANYTLVMGYYFYLKLRDELDSDHTEDFFESEDEFDNEFEEEPIYKFSFLDNFSVYYRKEIKEPVKISLDDLIDEYECLSVLLKEDTVYQIEDDTILMSQDLFQTLYIQILYNEMQFTDTAVYLEYDKKDQLDIKTKPFTYDEWRKKNSVELINSRIAINRNSK